MITVIATICLLSTGVCHDEQVTSSNFADISVTACLVGAPQLAEWMQAKPGYRLAKWRCQIGERRGA